MTPDISIIIVSWNVEGLLRDCLRSIVKTKGALAVETIVVDSGSHDDTPNMVRREFPDVQLIARSDNVGFPKGNNLGLEVANGRYLLLLNPDTIVHKNALQTMFAYMENNETVGMVGAQLLNADGSHQSSRRRFPTFWTGLFESTWLESFAPKSILNAYYVKDSGNDETADVDWVMGACMFVRREAFERVGWMDEDYFMYSEELDWCRRMKEADWRIVYLPTAKVTHLVGKSSEQAVTHRHINFNRAKLRYFKKYHGSMAALLLRALLLKGFMFQVLVEGVKWMVGHKRPLRRQRIQSYLQVLKSGLTPAGY